MRMFHAPFANGGEEDSQPTPGNFVDAHVHIWTDDFPKKPPHLDLAPLIKRVHEAFGSKRLMWGSDCPFQVQSETYAESISLLRDHLDFLSTADQEWILRRTAEETFFQ